MATISAPPVASRPGRAALCRATWDDARATQLAAKGENEAVNVDWSLEHWVEDAWSVWTVTRRTVCTSASFLTTTSSYHQFTTLAWIEVFMSSEHHNTLCPSPVALCCNETARALVPVSSLTGRARAPRSAAASRSPARPSSRDVGRGGRPPGVRSNRGAARVEDGMTRSEALARAVGFGTFGCFPPPTRDTIRRGDVNDSRRLTPPFPSPFPFSLLGAGGARTSGCCGTARAFRRRTTAGPSRATCPPLGVPRPRGGAGGSEGRRRRRRRGEGRGTEARRWVLTRRVDCSRTR